MTTDPADRIHRLIPKDFRTELPIPTRNPAGYPLLNSPYLF